MNEHRLKRILKKMGGTPVKNHHNYPQLGQVFSAISQVHSYPRHVKIIETHYYLFKYTCASTD